MTKPTNLVIHSPLFFNKGPNILFSFKTGVLSVLTPMGRLFKLKRKTIVVKKYQKSNTETTAMTTRGRCRKKAGDTFSDGSRATSFEATVTERKKPIIIKIICRMCMDCMSSRKAMCRKE